MKNGYFNAVLEMLEAGSVSRSVVLFWAVGDGGKPRGMIITTDYGKWSVGKWRKKSKRIGEHRLLSDASRLFIDFIETQAHSHILEP